MSILDRLLGKPSDEERKLEALGSHAREMIDGVVQLSSTTVKDIMVPRPDVVFVSVDAEPDELLDTIAESGHSRLPVYHKTVDDVIGVLYAKDLLGQLVSNGRKVSAGKAMRKPYFVPESKRVDELLHEFQRRRVHLAIVTDEYGGTSGIACMEDVLEEIVGDIQDEFDNVAPIHRLFTDKMMFHLEATSCRCDRTMNIINQGVVLHDDGAYKDILAEADEEIRQAELKYQQGIYQ